MTFDSGILQLDFGFTLLSTLTFLQPTLIHYHHPISWNFQNCPTPLYHYICCVKSLNPLDGLRVNAREVGWYCYIICGSNCIWRKLRRTFSDVRSYKDSVHVKFWVYVKSLSYIIIGLIFFKTLRVNGGGVLYRNFGCLFYHLQRKISEIFFWQHCEK